MLSSPTACPYANGASPLVDPALYSDRDPHPIWTGLRRHDPVSPHVTADGQRFWSVTTYPDADEVLRDHATFTSERGTLLYLVGKDDPAAGAQMAATDPPRHAVLREPLQRALAPKAVHGRREQIRAVIVDLLAPLADGGTYDLAEYMTRMPMAVIGAIMDLPAADWPRLSELSVACVAPEDPRFHRSGGIDAVLRASHREVFGYFSDVVKHRRNNLGDDLISILLRMEIDGRPLTPSEVVANCYSLLLGANVTTAQVPVTVLDEIMGTPALDEWANRPELLDSGVEEALRWATPTTHFMRYTTRDVTLRDRRISAGEPVVVWLGSANRDEDIFPDPFTFDPRRRPNKHLAFGIGPHYCVGHTVGRVTLRLLFGELFTRFHDLAPAGPGVRLYSNTVVGWTSLPITARVRPTFRPGASAKVR